MLDSIDKKFIEELSSREGKSLLHCHLLQKYYYHLLLGFYTDKQRTCKNCEYRFGNGTCMGIIGLLKVC